MVEEIDVDKNRKLSFLEWACAIYSKSWDKLHAPSVDPEEVARAEALLKQAAEEEAARKEAEAHARQVEDEKRITELRAKAQKAQAEQSVEEAKAAKEALDLELKRQAEDLKQRHADEAAEKARKEAVAAAERANSLKRQGVAGKVALFKYAAHDTKDPTRENEAKLKQEVAKKKQIRQQEIEAFAKKKLADEETARKKAEAEEAHKQALVAEEQARLAAERKVKAQRETLEAAQKAVAAEEERKKALEGQEASKREKEIYEQKKREDEEKKRLIREEEERKRAEGRAKLMSKSSLWNNNSASQVVNSIPANANLKKGTQTVEKSSLPQTSLLGQIRKGTHLSKTPGAIVPSDDLTDEQMVDYVADQIRKTSVAQ